MTGNDVVAVWLRVVLPKECNALELCAGMPRYQDHPAAAVTDPVEYHPTRWVGRRHELWHSSCYKPCLTVQKLLQPRAASNRQIAVAAPCSSVVIAFNAAVHTYERLCGLISDHHPIKWRMFIKMWCLNVVSCLTHALIPSHCVSLSNDTPVIFFWWSLQTEDIRLRLVSGLVTVLREEKRRSCVTLAPGKWWYITHGL